MGYLETDPTFRSEKSPMLEVTVVTVKRGTGTYADRTFYDKFKVQFYSRDAQALCQNPDIVKGSWVSVTGEAKAEGWINKQDPQKAHARITINAKTFMACVFDQKPEQ